ncbi:MAG: NAD-dependent epimerase/dehydratase family protein [Betaproteobacteria bacterium]|nr:MAG: NAD-dependent epimerase/dehydratase family protein [Betaproteobacteria bacterium]
MGSAGTAQRKHMTTALILGVNGQDGTFLARHLIRKGYKVVGIGRQETSRRDIESSLFRYHQADLSQREALDATLHEFRPDLIFHVAAVHTSAGGQYEPIWDQSLKVNVASVHSLLEYLRCVNPEGRLIYASSAKVFGEPYPPLMDETTPIKNACLYSITKNAAFHLIRYYRDRHSIKGSVVYLFNHESEFRPSDYFIPKMLRCLAAARRDPAHVASVNTLDFYCDWGSAEEYMSLLIEMIESAPAEDFVLGTGICTYAKDLVRNMFERYGLDCGRHLIEANTPGKALNSPYIVDTRKLQRAIHRRPVRRIYDVCVEMLEKLGTT